MRLNKNKRICLFTIAIMIAVIAIIFLLFYLAHPKRLVLYNADTKQVYSQWQIDGELKFSVEFIHSVNKSPVCDMFEVRDDKIIATATRYSAFGAGVQTEIEDGQTLSYDENGNMIVSGFNLPFDKLRYIVGTVYDHILNINGQSISLTALCGKNSAVIFEVKR